MLHQDVLSQLEECFSLVFPELDPAEIHQATMDRVELWDSLATLTLVSVVEEQFHIRVPLQTLPEFVSFARIAAFLETDASSRAA